VNGFLPPSEEGIRHELMPMLDALAEDCRRRDIPLLTLVITNYEDGRPDYDAVRRHWRIRYGVDPGELAVVALRESELERAYDYCQRHKPFG